MRIINRVTFPGWWRALAENIRLNVISLLPRRLAHHDDRSTWFAIHGRTPICCTGLVLWAGLRKSTKLNLDGEKNPSGHLQSSAGDVRMQMQVETSVGWFSLFQWKPSRSSFRFSERESEVFPHRDDLPIGFLPLETDFLKTSECISWIFFDGVLKHAGNSFQGVS